MDEQKNDEFQAQFKSLRDIGIQGLECCYSQYSTEKVRALETCAEATGLCVSGGSEYHERNHPVSAASPPSVFLALRMRLQMKMLPNGLPALKLLLEIIIISPLWQENHVVCRNNHPSN